jgi:MOSC domain-containing protein YiiM
MNGSIVSVNVSPIRSRDYGGHTVTTGIFKQPVAGAVPIRGVNLRGDDQADRDNHGGPDRAVYAYASEDYAWWEKQLERELPAGKFGENLTLAGIDVSGALIGERWRAGSAELVVTSPRVPCYKLAMTMEDPAFVRRFAQARRPGAYLAIVTEGIVAAGDRIDVLSRPAHDLTLEKMYAIYMFDRDRLSELLVPELPAFWRDWVLNQIDERASS